MKIIELAIKFWEEGSFIISNKYCKGFVELKGLNAFILVLCYFNISLTML